MLYCSDKTVEFHFSAAVSGGDILVNPRLTGGGGGDI